MSDNDETAVAPLGEDALLLEDQLGMNYSN
jgi:hypothetical protein